MKKIITVILVAVLMISAVSCNVIITTNDTSSSNETSNNVGDETEKEYPHSNMELAPLDEIIATTEHMSVPVSSFKYFFMDQYSSFISQYYYYLSYYNFDDSIPLHDQEYGFDENTDTWYDYFLQIGKDQFEQYAKFAEMALKEGMSLDENDNAKIEANLDSIEQAAAEYSETFEQYMSQFMGEGMTRQRMKAAIEITQLGYKYYQKLYNTPTYTEEQIEQVYKDAKGEYSLVDYYEASINALYDETDTDEQVEAAKNEVKEKAEKMKEFIIGGTSFAEAYDEATGAKQSDTEAETETETAAEAENGEEKANKYLYTAAEYDAAERYSFLYEDDTVEGQVNITYDDAGNAYIIQCVKLPYKNTEKLVTVRHILLSSADYDTEEEAYAAAQKMLEQINNAEDKKAEFLSLVPEYSSDSGSKTSGGLYENIAPGTTNTEFNAWCFDEERQVGDVDIILSDYGYHIMYFESFGDELWHYYCESDLRAEDFSKAADEIYSSVVITYNEDLLDRITK